MRVAYESYDFRKHPDEDLDYGFNLIDWLTAGETITDIGFEVVPTGIVELHDPVNALTQFATWVRGGEVGDKVRVQCTATTNAATPRIFTRTIGISIVAR